MFLHFDFAAHARAEKSKNNLGDVHRGMFEQNKGDDPYRNKVFFRRLGAWKEGETVRIVLDMDKGEMEFFKQDKLLGKIQIENTRDYYAAFVVSSNQKTDTKLTAELV